MTRNKKNVTVTLEREVAKWARIEAARRGMSVSQMLGHILENEMKGQSAYDLAKDRFFAQVPGLHRADGRPLPTREQVHDRDGLR